MLDVQDTPLVKWLKTKAKGGRDYAAKALELRAEIEDWLQYVPQTFGHYTRHTVGHSDAIIHNVSRLLFGGSGSKLVLAKLSPVEAYIVVAAAYLHDAGMVVSEEEKAKLLASDEWREWVSTSPWAQKERQDIEALRLDEGDPRDALRRHFLVDLRLRWLIAEYFRQRHHMRAKDIADRFEGLLGRFAFGDPDLLLAIGETCVAHGLDHTDLRDTKRFPIEREVSYCEVNLQLTSLLLRLGDLLDVSPRRACKLPRIAAAPLPASSAPHWDQFEVIRHRNFTPECIEISARSSDSAVRAVLSGWFTWIKKELGYARRAVQRWGPKNRHAKWKVPRARIKLEFLASTDAARSTCATPVKRELPAALRSIFVESYRRPWNEETCPPAALLRAEFQIVRFHLREREIDDLVTWCDAPTGPRLRVYEGPRGVGKTRLLLEACERLRRKGWATYFIAPSPDSWPQGALRDVLEPGPSLLVVDYAARYPTRVLDELLRSSIESRARTRIVALERGTLKWWRELKFNASNVVLDFLGSRSTQVLRLAPLAPDVEARRHSHEVASRCFGHEIGQPQSAPSWAEYLEAPGFADALPLHADALVQVLGGDGYDRNAVLRFVLNRERQFWAKQLASRGLHIDTQLLDVAVAWLFLADGSRNESETFSLLSSALERWRLPSSSLSALVNLLHTAYPDGSGGAERLQPDGLGELLLGDIVRWDAGALNGFEFE